MSLFSWTFKFMLSVVFDAADFFVGRIPVIGFAFDVAGGILGSFLWRPLGTLQFLELFDVTDQIDAFIPTLTIAAILSMKEIWQD